MKISANIHAVKITLSGITDTVTVADSNRTVNFNKPAGRFDTFSLVSTGKYDKESMYKNRRYCLHHWQDIYVKHYFLDQIVIFYQCHCPRTDTV